MFGSRRSGDGRNRIRVGIPIDDVGMPVRRCHKKTQVVQLYIVLVCGIGSSVFGWTA